MTQADSVHSTPPLNSSLCPAGNPLPNGRSESEDSFSHPPACIAAPHRNPHQRVCKARRGAIPPHGPRRSRDMLPAAIPAAASAVGADAELVRLGKQLEILVDAYYAARQPWARALSEAHRVRRATFGDPADRG
jgi:hypothetical protein